MMIEERTNEAWVADLADPARREAALNELRAILLRGLRRGLVQHVNTSKPEFEPLAEDFVQEAILKILANLETFNGTAKFTTWAHKIAVRVALTELRRKQWRDRSLDEMLSADSPFTFNVVDENPSPELSAQQRDLLAVINRLVEEGLTDKQREAIQLVAFEQMPIEEAAVRMAMRRNALYKLIHDARKRLKQLLEAQGLTTDDLLAAFG